MIDHVLRVYHCSGSEDKAMVGFAGGVKESFIEERTLSFRPVNIAL